MIIISDDQGYFEADRLKTPPDGGATRSVVCKRRLESSDWLAVSLTTGQTELRTTGAASLKLLRDILQGEQKYHPTLLAPVGVVSLINCSR